MDFIFKVDPIRRNIKVPDGFTVLTMDHNVHKLVFVCPYYEDFAFDSASIVFMVDAPDGRQYIIPAEEYESFPNSPSPYVKFTLTLKSYITSVVGYISFCITADIISSGNVIEKSWHSKNITISVGGHIDNDDSEDIPEEDVPTINQRLNNLDSKVGRLQTTVNGMVNGSPTPVATIAEMTDESAVYLYTGSETGYTAGNWYFWNGTAWTSGGTYGGAVTDTTLSIEGEAADAKAVGDALADKADADDLDALETTVSGKADSADVTAIDTRVTAVEEITSEIDGLLSTTEPVALTYMSHTYIEPNGGTGTSSAYNLYKIGLTGISKIRITSQNASRRTASIAFYNVALEDLSTTTAIPDNCLLVGTIHETTDQTEYTEEYDVPDGALSCLVSSASAYGLPTVDKFVYVDVVGGIENIRGSVTDKVDKADTIYTSGDTPTYLSHKYLHAETGLPPATTSGNWNLYKVDVTDCDAVRIKTYRTSTGTSGLPVHTFLSTDFDDVTSTSETESTVVEVGKRYTATEDMIVETVVVPDGAKSMFVISQVDHTGYPVILKYHYGNFDALKNVSENNDRLTVLENQTEGLVVYSKSPYYRDVRWGTGVLAEYYHSEDDGVSLFPYTTTASEYFAMFNTLVAGYAGYAESHQMGLASDESTMMYYYTFNPLTGEDDATHKRPKIIISSGQHGFEKTANYGVYHFIKDLLENWESNSFLDYVRNHVILIVMPMLNPWGHDNDKYVNANGVNLNRNWDTQAWSQGGSPGGTTYGGASPLDQPETQYASAVILNNLDAFWLMDFHNNGQVAPRAANSYLWHSFGLVTYNDPYFAKAVNAAKFHVDETTGHLYKDYPDRCDYVVSGHFTDNNAPSHQGLITAYAREHNIMAATIEGAAAFMGYGNRYTSGIHHLNADLLGNWVRILISNYARLEE